MHNITQILIGGGEAMFIQGQHYKNRQFGFKVLEIKGNKMLVLLENDEKVILSVDIQTRIQQNISTKNINSSTPAKFSQRNNSSEWKQSISAWQINSLANLNKETIRKT